MSIKTQVEDFKAYTTDCVPEAGLAEKFRQNRPLRVKLGVDPTSADLHLGHAVVLRKMRQFQDRGDTGILVIGDGTARIGDPSGRNTTRPTLSPEEIAENAKTYVEQAFCILDPERTEVVYNASWIDALSLSDLLHLMSQFTVARVLERDDFAKRYAAHAPIALHEFLYPVLQAYDSVVIKADVELGGSDQIFNLLAGRALMEREGLEPQVAITTPLLVGLDGVKKMSKSTGNYIGLKDDPADMYGKVMSIPDDLLGNYWCYAATATVSKINDIVRTLEAGTADPYALKRELAANIVATYHGDDAAKEAEKTFVRIFKKHERPDAPTVAVEFKLNDDGEVYLPALLCELGLASSNSDARRLIDGKAVKINDVVCAPHAYTAAPKTLEHAYIQAGKRKAAQIA